MTESILCFNTAYKIISLIIIISTLLHDLAVLQHNDEVRAPKKLDMMCAQNARLLRQQTQDALIEQVLGNVRVHSSQWVVKEVHTLILK